MHTVLVVACILKARYVACFRRLKSLCGGLVGSHSSRISQLLGLQSGVGNNRIIDCNHVVSFLKRFGIAFKFDKKNSGFYSFTYFCRPVSDDQGTSRYHDLKRTAECSTSSINNPHIIATHEQYSDLSKVTLF
jgi:hypothetical protein